MSATKRYDNPSSQRERREVAKNDRRVRQAGTFHQFAASESDIVGGRYSAQTKAKVIGSEPVSYPNLPQGASYADRLPDEPPLGYAVDEPPIVGEVFEVERSLADARDGAGTTPTGTAESASPGGGEERSVQGGNPAGQPRRRSTRKVKR